MYCKKCGNQIEDFANFCWACGSALHAPTNNWNQPQPMINYVPPTPKSTESTNNAIKGIGIALTIIGLICGVLVTIFIASHGSPFGYDSWDYYYNGGKDLGVGIAIFSGASLLIGICILIGSSTSKRRNEPVVIAQTPISFKKCTYCGKISPMETTKCSCGCFTFERAYDRNQSMTHKCDVCNLKSNKTTYVKLVNATETSYKNVCDNCMKGYDITLTKK